MQQWLRLWLESRENLAPSTMRSYAMHARRHLMPQMGRERVAELTPARVQTMLISLIRTHAASGQPLSPATLQRIHATLRTALNAAVRRGLLASNPAHVVELPSGSKPHPVVWTPTRIALRQASGIRPAVAVWTADQTAEFLAWLRLREQPLYVLFHLVALLGLRRGEAAGLQWADVDLQARTVTVVRQVRQIGKHLELAAPKSASSNRVIALDHTTAALLQGHPVAPPLAAPTCASDLVLHRHTRSERAVRAPEQEAGRITEAFDFHDQPGHWETAGDRLAKDSPFGTARVCRAGCCTSSAPARWPSSCGTSTAPAR
ncbi:hypothetical protein ABFJ78_00550 [Amycolatopsis sp. MEPSY49]